MKVRILAEFTVAPENTIRAKALFEEVAIESAKEEGCETYELRQVFGEENTFIIYEVFTDREAQAFHKTTKHFGWTLKTLIEPLIINKTVRYLI